MQLNRTRRRAILNAVTHGNGLLPLDTELEEHAQIKAEFIHLLQTWLAETYGSPETQAEMRVLAKYGHAYGHGVGCQPYDGDGSDVAINLQVRLPGDHLWEHRMGFRVPLPTGVELVPKELHYRSTFDTQLGEAQERVRELTTRFGQLVEAWRERYRRFHADLAAVRTVEALAERWPELADKINGAVACAS